MIWSTLDTPVGPFTGLVDAHGAVLAAGWTDGPERLLPLVHPSLRSADVAEGELGADGCAMFLSEPRFDDLPCVMETPGPDKRGPTPEQVQLAKDLRRRGLAKRRRAAARAA